MPTGPFAALGTWPIFDHDGSTPRIGAASTLTILKATRKYIKYTRGDSKRENHGKVYRWEKRTYRVSVGFFQYIVAKV